VKDEKKATWLAIIGNSILFIGKLIVGISYNSISIISDAVNSFTDIIASLIVHISVLVSYRAPDKEHQFGHQRAQPIAGLIVAIFIGIVGFEIISASVRRLISGGSIRFGFLPALVLLGVIVTKFSMFIYTRNIWKKTHSTALKANIVDHRNDVIISTAVLLGVLFSNLGYPILDPIVAIIMGFYIIKAGFEVGLENIRFLMGQAPSEKLFKKIEGQAISIKGVIGVNDVSAHYVGTSVEAEVHIYVNNKMKLELAHDISHKVQRKIEKLSEISRAFVHIDPFTGKFGRKRKF